MGWREKIRESYLRKNVRHPLASIGIETLSDLSTIPGRYPNRNRLAKVLAISQGLLIVSLLSWIATGFITIPSQIMSNFLLAGALAAGPLIVPLWTGIVIGASVVYFADRRVNQEKRIIQYLFELIE